MSGKIIKKHLFIVMLIFWCLVFSVCCSFSVSAETTSYGLEYTKTTDNTIKITGFSGALSEGEDFQIPSQIDGYTVTEIDGEIGTKGANYGRLIIPDSVTKISKLKIYGFSGKLVIPSSVREILAVKDATKGEFGGLWEEGNITEVEINANTEKIPELHGFANVEKIVIGEGIKYALPLATMNGNPIQTPSPIIRSKNLKELWLPDSFTYMDWDEASLPNCTIYLKKIDGREFKGNVNYYYTNEGETFDVEKILISQDAVQHKMSNGEYKIYKGMSGRISAKNLPINAAKVPNYIYQSSDNSVITIDSEGNFTVVGIGKATLTVSHGNINNELKFSSYGIVFFNESSGIIADNMEENIDLSNIPDEAEDVTVKLDTDELPTIGNEADDVIEYGEGDITIEEAYNICIKALSGDDTTILQPKDGKKIKIKLPLKQGTKLLGLKICHVVNNSCEWIECSIIKENDKDYIVFETSHFSHFYVCNVSDNGSDSCEHIISTEWVSDNDDNHYHVCSVCDNKTDITAHSYDNGVITTPATEQATGIKTYTCSICDHTKTEIVPKLDHTHKLETDYSSDATGHWYACSGCDEKVDFEPHTEDSGTVTTEPTETTEGVKTYKCVKCEYVMRTEAISTITSEHTHEYGTEWKSDSTSHWHECECGKKSDVSNHISDGGKITVPVTDYTNGVKTYTCTVCGYVMGTETIFAKGPNNGHYYPIYPVIPTTSTEPGYTVSAVKFTEKVSVKTSIKGDTLILSWDEISNADKYYVYQYKNGKYVGIKSTANNSVSLKGLKNGESYQFMVRYVVDGKLSPMVYSGKSTVKMIFKPYPKAVAGKDSVKLSWKAVPKAEKYAIYKYVDGKAIKIAEVKSTSVKINKLSPDTEYSYIVSAYVDGEWTKMYKSDIVTVKTLAE